MSLTGSKTNSLSVVVIDSESHLLIAAGGAMVQENHRSYTLRELIAWNLPDGDVRWHVVEKAKERISDLAIRPITKELATKCTGSITIWSSDGKPLRNVENDFLAGPIVFSPNGEFWVSPHGNVVKVRSSDTGQIVTALPIAKSTYTSARAAAFVPRTSCLLVGAQVISAKGHTSGQLLLLDIDRQKVLKSSSIEIEPAQLVVDPRGSWACVAGQRRNRGYLMIWDLEKWKCVAEQGAHGASLDSVVVSPSGEQLATTGTDHVIRIWDTTTWKTVAKLDKHMAEDNSSACIAWSHNGSYLAFASSGAPPRGCVAVYIRNGEEWNLLEFGSSASQTSRVADNSTLNLRPLRICGDDEKMDTVGNFDLSANSRPVKCPHCKMVDIDAVPEPYLLSRRFTAPGDFRSAELGNFFVRQRARHILEIVAPNACRFYPTLNGKSKQPTDWFLAVPQATVETAKLPEKYEKCSVCGEPIAVGRLDPLDFQAPPVDIFKSLQWTCSGIGEETLGYVEDFLKLPRDSIPRHQSTRAKLDRELWMSTRLLFLMKQFKFVGSYASELRNRKPTPEEAEWIVAQVRKVTSNQLPSVRSDERGSVEWLRQYLDKNRSILPITITTRKKIQEWERKHNISLPPSYVEFVTTMRRNSYSDVMGRKGYKVRILGPKGLDAQEYRRDAPASESELSEPDGLLFAVASNGDGFCFDLRGNEPELPVVHFNHETDAFKPFADCFAEAIRRFVEQI